MNLKKYTKIALISFTILLLVLTIAVAKKDTKHVPTHIKEGKGVFIEQDNLRVKSLQETFFCSNIVSEHGCLIQAKLEITNKKGSNQDLDIWFDSNKDVTIRDYSVDLQNIAIDKSKGKSIKSQNKKQFKNNKVTPVLLNFWAKESGKFNLSIRLGSDVYVLDPFFNITYNTSSPSLHLLNGTSNLVNDSNYTQTVNITTGLSDGSDVTTFETSSLTDTLAYYRFEEGSGTDAEDSSGNGLDGTIFGGGSYVSSSGERNTGDFALNFDGSNDEVVISDSGNDFQFGDGATDDPFSMAAWIKMSDATQFRIAQKYETGNQEFIWTTSTTDVMLIQVKDFSSSGTLDKRTSLALTSAQGIWTHVAFTYDGSSSSSGLKLYINGTLQSVTDSSSGGYTAMEDRGVDFRIGGENSAQWTDGQIDELAVFDRELTQADIEEIFNSGIPNEAKAIRANFDLELNSANQYWLRTRKTTSGVHTGSVYLYANNNAIDNTTLDTGSINTGWDAIQLSNSVINGANATFRFYTDDIASFSELQLIEGINDSANPMIIDEALNNSNLICNQTIRFQANVTDDRQVMDVDITYVDFAGSHTVSADKIINTDIYFVDVTYSQSTAGISSYNYTQVTATDIASNVVSSFPNLTYQYTCIQPDVTPPVITTQAVNGTVLNKLEQNFITNSTCTDNINLTHFELTLRNSSAVQLNLTNITSLAPSSLEIKQSVNLSTFGVGIYTARAFCIDGSGNNAYEEFTVGLADFDAFVNLVSPTNNTFTDIQSPSDQINFNYVLGFQSTCSLKFNGSTVATQSTADGSQSFNVDFSNIGFLSNQTVQWELDCLPTGFASNITSEFNVLTYTISTEDVLMPEYQVNQCPVDSIPKVGFFFMMFIVAFILIVLAFVFKNGMIGFMGSAVLMVLSAYTYACIALFGFIMTGTAILFMSLFIIRGVKGFK